MAKKLYVGNLSYTTTDDSLRQAFSAYGAVSSATVITDRMSGRSKGFGFVEMENASLADCSHESLLSYSPRCCCQTRRNEGITEMRWVPLRECLTMIRDGVITDGQAIVALSIAALHIQKGL